MGISSVNDYSSIFQNYRVPSIPSVSIDDVKRQDAGLQDKPLQNVSDSAPALVRENRQNAGLQDIPLTYKSEKDYGFIGKDKDLAALDVPKAISDDKKDDILKDYQYFVGSSRELASQSEDGLVIAKF